MPWGSWRTAQDQVRTLLWGGGRKAVALEGSPGLDHLRQVGMGTLLLLLWNVIWGCFAVGA